jgi:alpha-D-xyloside xylohydrolase
MISPVLEQGKSQVKALFPPGSWYNLFDMTQAITSEGGQYVTLDAPLHVVNVHLHQNTILPMQQGGMISKEARMTPFALVVTFPAGASDGKAAGKLFLDDDELPEMKLASGSATYVDFYATVSQGTVKLWSEVQESKFALDKGWKISKVAVLGLGRSGAPSALEFDGKPVTAASNIELTSLEQKYLEDLQVGSEKKSSVMVEVNGLEIPVGKNFAMSWKMGISG